MTTLKPPSLSFPSCSFHRFHTVRGSIHRGSRGTPLSRDPTSQRMLRRPSMVDRLRSTVLCFHICNLSIHQRDRPVCFSKKCTSVKKTLERDVNSGKYWRSKCSIKTQPSCTLSPESRAFDSFKAAPCREHGHTATDSFLDPFTDTLTSAERSHWPTSPRLPFPAEEKGHLVLRLALNCTWRGPVLWKRAESKALVSFWSTRILASRL